jgi:hypothetical protein
VDDRDKFIINYDKDYYVRIPRQHISMLIAFNLIRNCGRRTRSFFVFLQLHVLHSYRKMVPQLFKNPMGLLSGHDCNPLVRSTRGNFSCSLQATKLPRVRMLSVAHCLLRATFAPIKHVWLLLLIAIGKQLVARTTRRNGIASCAACNKLLSIGRLLAKSKKSCLVCCGL